MLCSVVHNLYPLRYYSLMWMREFSYVKIQYTKWYIKWKSPHTINFKAVQDKKRRLWLISTPHTWRKTRSITFSQILLESLCVKCEYCTQHFLYAWNRDDKRILNEMNHKCTYTFLHTHTYSFTYKQHYVAQTSLNAYIRYLNKITY